MSNVTVAVSSDFLTAYATLPKQILNKIQNFVSKFTSNPKAPGINFEKIFDAADRNLRSVRIDDTYRGILLMPENGNVFVLLWVDHHDEAYEWARRKRCLIDTATGALQIFTVVDMPHPDIHAAPSSSGPYHEITDLEFTTMGVDHSLIPTIRAFQAVDQLLSIKSFLTQLAYEALEMFGAGVKMADVLHEYFPHAPNATIEDKFEEALNKASSKQFFHVIQGEEELITMLAAPLEKWRIFLHASQRKVVERNYTGPARVVGGAGTGKTVVAMHRAKELAKKPTTQHILFTTFTTNLANDIRGNLRKLCAPDIFNKIEIMNLDAWTNNYIKGMSSPKEIIYGDMLDQAWNQTMHQACIHVDFDKSFYQNEWMNIVLPNEIETIEQYLAFNRAGYGSRIDKSQRKRVWEVLSAYQEVLETMSAYDIDTAYEIVRRSVLEKKQAAAYDSIIVDEAQDFSPCAFKLLRALAGNEHSNDLFIVGDSHQRIYRNKAVLSRCGTNIRGRSAVLWLNYRTTEEIRRYATQLFEKERFDDLDGGNEDGKGYVSLFHGERPSCDQYETIHDEGRDILNKIISLVSQGAVLESICISTRTKRLLEQYRSILEQAKIRTFEIKNQKADEQALPGVRLATMHRVKGVEFDHVFLPGLNDGIMPLEQALGNEHEQNSTLYDEKLKAERCLLYVAMTRAKCSLSISCHNKPSHFLMDKLFQR